MDIKKLIEKFDKSVEIARREGHEQFGMVFEVKECIEFLNEFKAVDDNACCACCKPYNELEATVPLMLSDDYKARFVGEYRQTKIRYERLKAFCNRIEAARMTPERDEIEEPKHDCPLELLRNQQRAMGEYLHTMEIRAVIERIEL